MQLCVVVFYIYIYILGMLSDIVCVQFRLFVILFCVYIFIYYIISATQFSLFLRTIFFLVKYHFREAFFQLIIILSGNLNTFNKTHVQTYIYTLFRLTNQNNTKKQCDISLYMSNIIEYYRILLYNEQ